MLRVDAGLVRRLNAHQVDGVCWPLVRSPRGAILADGMGVGKTLQALTLVHTLVDGGVAVRVLIVVPSALVFK